MDQAAEVVLAIVVAGGLVVDVAVPQNEEEAHLAPVDLPRGRALISRLPSHLTAMPLNHLSEYPRNFCL